MLNRGGKQINEYRLVLWELFDWMVLVLKATDFVSLIPSKEQPKI